MDKLSELVGRSIGCSNTRGAGCRARDRHDGSGAEAAQETVDYLTARGEQVGLLKVRLFRPFSVSHLMEALPATVRQIAVLDRTKEAGAAGDPLYLDVVNALHEGFTSGLAAVKSSL